jgi:hypothetical protein
MEKVRRVFAGPGEDSIVVKPQSSKTRDGDVNTPTLTGGV